MFFTSFMTFPRIQHPTCNSHAMEWTDLLKVPTSQVLPVSRQVCAPVEMGEPGRYTLASEPPRGWLAHLPGSRALRTEHTEQESPQEMSRLRPGSICPRQEIGRLSQINYVN